MHSQPIFGTLVATNLHDTVRHTVGAPTLPAPARPGSTVVGRMLQQGWRLVMAPKGARRRA